MVILVSEKASTNGRRMMRVLAERRNTLSMRSLGLIQKGPLQICDIKTVSKES